MAELLRVIERFDTLVAGAAEVEELVRVAAEITGCLVGVHYARTASSVVVRANGSFAADAAAGRVVLTSVVGQRLRGGLSRALATSPPCVAASVEVADGRVGVAWVEGEATDIVMMVVERLAAAAAISSLAGADALGRGRGEESADQALAQLLGESLDDAAASRAREAAGLPGGLLRAVVALENPPGAAAPDVIGAALVRALSRENVRARYLVRSGEVVVVLGDQDGLAPAVGRAVQGRDLQALGVRIGVGDCVVAADAQRSVRQARQALSLGALAPSNTPGVTGWDALGALQALAEVPDDAIAASGDVQRLARLTGSSGGVSDLRLLERYCELGSLRAAAADLYLHHSSVDYRLKRIAERLEVDLAVPGDRFRALLAVKLLLVRQAREASDTRR